LEVGSVRGEGAVETGEGKAEGKGGKLKEVIWERWRKGSVSSLSGTSNEKTNLHPAADVRIIRTIPQARADPVRVPA